MVGAVKIKPRFIPAAAGNGAHVGEKSGRLFWTEPCRSPTLILSCASAGRPVRSHGLPPRRTSCSAQPSSRCTALSVYFNTNLGSTLFSRHIEYQNGERQLAVRIVPVRKDVPELTV